MLVLVDLCVIVAVMPQGIAGLLRGVLSQLIGLDMDRAWPVVGPAAPLDDIGFLNAVMLAAGIALTPIILAWKRKTREKDVPTWGCGYARPTERMQYTGRSFAEMLAEQLLPPLPPAAHETAGASGLFPSKSDFASETPDPLSEKLLQPFFRHWAERFSRLRILHHGQLHVYLLYIVLTVVLALAWASVRTWWDSP